MWVNRLCFNYLWLSENAVQNIVKRFQIRQKVRLPTLVTVLAIGLFF
jgi:hypothetical protein